MGRKKISYYGVKLVSSSVSHPATHRRFDRFRKKNSICKSKSKDPAWGSTTNAELAFSPLCSPLRFLFPFESFQSPTLRPPETSARGVHHGVLDRPLVRHDFNSSRIALPMCRAERVRAPSSMLTKPARVSSTTPMAHPSKNGSAP